MSSRTSSRFSRRRLVNTSALSCSAEITARLMFSSSVEAERAAHTLVTRPPTDANCTVAPDAVSAMSAVQAVGSALGAPLVPLLVDAETLSTCKHVAAYEPLASSVRQSYMRYVPTNRLLPGVKHRSNRSARGVGVCTRRARLRRQWP